MAVVRFILEGVPLAFGAVTATHILNNHHIAARGSFEPKGNATVFVVGRALQEHGKFPIRLRTVDVGTQRDPSRIFTWTPRS
jgi:hypothetical protein